MNAAIFIWLIHALAWTSSPDSPWDGYIHRVRALESKVRTVCREEQERLGQELRAFT